MKDIEKMKREIVNQDIEIANLQGKINAMNDLLTAMREAQETRKKMLEALQVLHQVNNN